MSVSDCTRSCLRAQKYPKTSWGAPSPLVYPLFYQFLDLPLKKVLLRGLENHTCQRFHNNYILAIIISYVYSKHVNFGTCSQSVHSRERGFLQSAYNLSALMFVLCWEVCPLSERPLSEVFTVPVYPHHDGRPRISPTPQHHGHHPTHIIVIAWRNNFITKTLIPLPNDQ